jgi:hypothetical protein
MCSKQIAASWCLYKEVGREMKAAASNAPTQKSSAKQKSNSNKRKQRQATRVIKKSARGMQCEQAHAKSSIAAPSKKSSGNKKSSVKPRM